MLDFVGRHFYKAKKRALKTLENTTVPPEKRHGINIKPLLLKFSRMQPTDEKFLNRFRLDLLDDQREKFKFGEIYDTCAFRFDARFYFVLAYLDTNDKAVGVCLLGFEIEGNKILIKQIQGIRFDSWSYSAQKQKKVEEALLFLRWEKFLVKVCEIWAAKLGFKKIGILKAENNPYFIKIGFSPLTESELARNNRLFMHYNVTAKRMGYKLKTKSKYFMKSLKKTPRLKGCFNSVNILFILR